MKVRLTVPWEEKQPKQYIIPFVINKNRNTEGKIPNSFVPSLFIIISYNMQGI